MLNYPIIAVAGKAGAGKDTFATLLQLSLMQKAELYKVYAFADPIYKFLSELLGVSVEHLQDRKYKEKVQIINIGNGKEFEQRFISLFNSLVWEFANKNPDAYAESNYTGDIVLDAYGKFLELCNVETKGFFKKRIELTASFRQMLQYIGTEIFREMVYQDFWTAIAPKNDVIIVGCRFKNEFNFVKENDGVVVKVVNPNLVEIEESGHVSEEFVNVMQADYDIKNEGKVIEDLEKAVEEFINVAL